MELPPEPRPAPFQKADSVRGAPRQEVHTLAAGKDLLARGAMSVTHYETIGERPEIELGQISTRPVERGNGDP